MTHWGPHNVRPSRPHKLVFLHLSLICTSHHTWSHIDLHDTFIDTCFSGTTNAYKLHVVSRAITTSLVLYKTMFTTQTTVKTDCSPSVIKQFFSSYKLVFFEYFVENRNHTTQKTHGCKVMAHQTFFPLHNVQVKQRTPKHKSNKTKPTTRWCDL